MCFFLFFFFAKIGLSLKKLMLLNNLLLRYPPPLTPLTLRLIDEMEHQPASQENVNGVLAVVGEGLSHPQTFKK